MTSSIYSAIKTEFGLSTIVPPMTTSVAMYAEALGDAYHSVRRHAVVVLKSLGALAKPALRALDHAIKNEIVDDVRTLMREARAKIAIAK